MFDQPEYSGLPGFAGALFRLRFRRLRLSQQQFADRFGLSVGALRDVEQGRVRPSLALSVLLEAIALDPALVTKAALNAAVSRVAHARARGGCGKTTELP